MSSSTAVKRRRKVHGLGSSLCTTSTPKSSSAARHWSRTNIFSLVKTFFRIQIHQFQITLEICVKLIFSLLQPRIASGAKEHPNKVTTRRTPSSSQANTIFAISKRTRSEEISLRSHFILTGNRTQPTSMLTLRSRRLNMRCISPMLCSPSVCRTLMLC